MAAFFVLKKKGEVMKMEDGAYRKLTQAEKDERRRRDYQFKMRMNEREKAEIQRRMKETGYENMNDYLIDMATQGYILIPQGKYIEPIRDCTYELNKIGVNVNQMVKRSHCPKGKVQYQSILSGTIQ